MLRAERIFFTSVPVLKVETVPTHDRSGRPTTASVFHFDLIDIRQHKADLSVARKWFHPRRFIFSFAWGLLFAVFIIPASLLLGAIFTWGALSTEGAATVAWLGLLISAPVAYFTAANWSNRDAFLKEHARIERGNLRADLLCLEKKALLRFLVRATAEIRAQDMISGSQDTIRRAALLRLISDTQKDTPQGPTQS